MLQLKQEFKETICRLYIEKNNPQKYKSLLQEASEDFQFSSIALRRHSFYDLINTQEGFLTLQGYFIKAALLLDRDNDTTANDVHNMYNQQIIQGMQTGGGITGSGSRPYMAQSFHNQYRGMATSHHAYTGGTLYSSICIEVDEFKFYKIIKNIIQRA